MIINYEVLPLNSGADAFLEIKFQFKNDTDMGFHITQSADSEDYQFILNLQNKMTEAFISCMKEDWMMSEPLITYNPRTSSVSAKIACRKKKFFKEITKE